MKDECVKHVCMYINTFVENKRYAEELIRLKHERSKLGQKKYNTTLKDNPLSHKDKYIYLLEEELDALSYTAKIILESDKAIEKDYHLGQMKHKIIKIEKDYEMYKLCSEQ